MKIPFLPTTRLGKWSAWLVILGLVLFVLLYLFAENLSLLTGPLVTILGLASVLFALAGGITGVIALFRGKDRAFLVILAVVSGIGHFVIILLSMATDLLQ